VFRGRGLLNHSHLNFPQSARGKVCRPAARGLWVLRWRSSGPTLGGQSLPAPNIWPAYRVTRLITRKREAKEPLMSLSSWSLHRADQASCSSQTEGGTTWLS
jgi:hypothetical protein